jgi:hypothetical protein
MIAELLTATALILPTVPGVYQGPGCAGHPKRPPESYTNALKVRHLRELATPIRTRVTIRRTILSR